MHEHLRIAARERHACALRRARIAVKALSSAPEPVTFAAVARRAGVSTDFLYGTPELRQVIEQLRDTPESSDNSTPNSAAGALRALTAKLAHERARHRAEIEQLLRALEQAHGENLVLRRRLSRYE